MLAASSMCAFWASLVGVAGVSILIEVIVETRVTKEKERMSCLRLNTKSDSTVNTQKSGISLSYTSGIGVMSVRMWSPLGVQC